MAAAVAAAAAPRCCLTSPANDYLTRQGVAVSLVNHRLRQAVCPPPAVHLDQAQAVHAFLLQQQRLRRISSAALVIESTPEALCLDVQGQLRPLLATLKELGMSQVRPPPVPSLSVFWEDRACAARRQAGRFDRGVAPQGGVLPCRAAAAPVAGRRVCCRRGHTQPALSPCPAAHRSRRRLCSARCVGTASRPRSSWRWARPSCAAASSG